MEVVKVVRIRAATETRKKSKSKKKNTAFAQETDGMYGGAQSDDWEIEESCTEGHGASSRSRNSKSKSEQDEAISSFYITNMQ